MKRSVVDEPCDAPALRCIRGYLLAITAVMRVKDEHFATIPCKKHVKKDRSRGSPLCYARPEVLQRNEETSSKTQLAKDFEQCMCDLLLHHGSDG